MTGSKRKWRGGRQIVTPSEARVVKRQLESYQDYLKLAAEADRESVALGAYYVDISTPGCIRYQQEPGGPGRSLESRRNEVLSDQMDADKRASFYREKADRIKRFILAADHPRRDYLEQAYLQGKRYREIADEAFCETSSVAKAIVRCIEAMPSELAKSNLLL